MTETLSQARWSGESEESILGAALLSRPALEVMVSSLRPEDFYKSAHQFIAATMLDLYQSSSVVDSVTVADVLRRQGKLEAIGGTATLVHLSSSAVSLNARHATAYAVNIRREAGARALQWATSKSYKALGEGADPVAVADQLEAEVRSMDRGGKLPARYYRSTSDYLAEDHSATTTPLAEGVCYPLSKIMVLALEKIGKTTLIKQIGSCMSAGLHPFDPRIRIDPIPTLILDGENDDAELEVSMRRIEHCITLALGPDWTRPAFFTLPYGMDVELPRDRGELLDVLEDCKPRLIVGGPIYKMTDQTKDLSEDRRAALVQRIFNEAQKRLGAACILEHHVPTGTPKGRPLKAKGGQVWPAWVNATIGLNPINNGMSIEVQYPHPTRGHFAWPARFDRGTSSADWPWIPVLRAADAKRAAGQRMDLGPEPIEEEDAEPPF